MPRKKIVEFQSITPLYPEEGYIAILFLINTNTDSGEGLAPMKEVYTSLDEVSLAVERELKKSNLEGYSVPDDMIIIPSSLGTLFPMKKEYWVEKASLEYGLFERMMAFIPVAKNPELFHILVTPSHLSATGKVVTHVALPLINGHDLTTIERFMMTSDLPVDERATDSAIYYLGSALRYNWRTKEVSEGPKYAITKAN